MTTDSTNIHRYLDDAFADIPRTPENQDLKEEIRGNLAARVAELESAGAKPDAAAAKAIRELGDIHQLVDSIEDAAPGESTETAARLIALNRVRISPLYVVRTVLLSLLLAAGITLVTLGAFHLLDWSVAGLTALSAVTGAFVGIIVGDAISHETSHHYPVSPARATGFGAAAFAGLAGLAVLGVYFGNPSVLWLLVTGCLLALVSLVAFISLGVTQTNRQKQWVTDLNRSYEFQDRFSRDPAAAARFGLYTVIIWVLAIGAFVGLSIAIGFVWSWVALLAGLVVFMLVLARMLFPASADRENTTHE